MTSSCSTRFTLAAVLAVLGAFAPALRAQDEGRPNYYLRGSDASGKTSLSSGGNSSVGWATTLGGAKAKNGVDDATAIYHIPLTYMLRTPTSGNQTFGGYRLVFEGTTPSLLLKAVNATLTIGRLTVKADAQADIIAGDTATFTLAGSDWQVEEGAVLGLGASIDTNGRNIICASTISGNGTVAAIGNGAYNGTVTLSGDLSGFTGRLHAAMPRLATIAGPYGAANMKPASHTLVIGAASAFPTATPYGDIVADAVTVPDGATLRFSCDVTSPANRGWDLGSGAAPTICVDAGHTVTVLGPVSGSAGFNKTGDGTLVLNVGGKGEYDTITLTGAGAVSPERLAQYAAACAQWQSELPPEVSAPVATAVAANALTVSSRVHNLPAGASATLSFAYGVTPDLLTRTNVVSAPVTAAPSSVSTTLTRLTPGVVYYARAALVTDEEPPRTAVSKVVALQTEPAPEPPAGYAPLEYIATDGSDKPYIDTGYLPTSNTKIAIDMAYLGTDYTGDWVPIWGYRKKANSDAYAMFVKNDATQFALNFKATDTKSTSGVIRGERFIFRNDNARHYVTRLERSENETCIYSAADQTFAAEAGWTVALFGFRTATGAAASAFDCRQVKMRLYRFKIWEGSTLVRDFVPVRREADSAIGLYDLLGEGGFLANKGTGSLAESVFTAAEVTADNALDSIALSFSAASETRALRVAYGPSNAGIVPANWYATAAVATVAAGETTFSFTPPAEWGDDDHLVLRFYFDGTAPVDWSNAIYWQDYSAPAVTDVALDGTGGDTIVVSGTLASFPGDSCALSVYTGDSPTSLDHAWTGLAGGVRDATGAFTFTLHEPDTSAARFIAPGETYYVSIQAVADGKVTRTEPVAVTTKAAPTFAAAPTATANRRTVTFTGRLSDLGMTGGTTVRLYVGEPGDAEDDLLAVESPVAVTDTATSFSITHAFADFEVAHPWQLRAVATSTNGTATAETRSALATVTTKDTTAYTWKSSVTAGDWSDAANWTDNQDGDCLGYPASANATVTFPAGTAATVRFTEALTVGAVNMAANLNVTFVQGGASAAATKLTASTLTMHDNKSSGGKITLDGVAIQSSSGDTYLDTYRALHLVNGADLYVAAIFGNQVSNDVVVANGSILNCNNMYFGGGTITISNSTVQVRSGNNVGRIRVGGHIIFQGTTPRWYSANKDGCFYAELAAANVQLDFLVPAGGYEAAPIQGPASPTYYFGNNKGNAGSCAYTVNVLDESPANFVDASVTTPLIWWKKGINKARTLEGDLPAYGQGAVSDDAFSWSTDNASYPTNLLVTINGSSNAGKLQVSGSLGTYGAADLSPAYGYTAVPAEGLDGSAPAIVPLSDVARAVCTGWKLYAVDPATLTRTVLDSGSETTAHVAPAATWRELEWQWERQYLVTAAAQGPGTVAPASQWVAEGASATVAATPNDATSLFHSWAESILGGEYTDNPLTVAVNTNYAFTARFGGDYYVSMQGSDQNDGLTPATALATVGEAVLRANRTYGSRITVLPGTYPLAGAQEWIALTNAVTLASQTGNPDDVVIDCCGGYGLCASNALARIESVRIASSYGGAVNGHALWIYGGSATNIIVCNLTGMQYAAVRVTGGTLGGLLFTNNVNSAQAANGGVILDGAGSCLTTSTFIRNKAGAAPVYIPASGCYIEDCNFLTNIMVGSYGKIANANGGAIYATQQATYIRRCQFIGNTGNETGACFLNNGGYLSDCLFQGNEASYHGSCIRCWYNNLTVERCVFTGNIGNDTGIVNAPSGTTYFRNCLFADNRSKGGAPGGVNSGNTVHLQNCTFYGNRSTTGSIHAANLSKAASTIKNCVFYGNGPAADSRNTSFGGTVQNTCYPEAAAGNTAGNFADNPLFVDAENGDFHLQYGSPCLDAGQELLAVDLDGDERPQDGNADGEAVSDLGCYEMPPNANPVTATLSVTEAGAIAPADAALSVFVSGVNLEGLAFTWRAIRDADGTLTTVERTSTAMATADTATYTFTGLEPGVWRFEVTVENGAGDKATSAAEGSYVVGPDTCYVAPDGGHVWPYDTPAGAATNFCDPAALKPRTIRVAPGEYGPGLPRMTDATIERSWLAAIESPTAIVGPDDPAEAVIHCGGDLGIFLGNAEASVSGLMFDRPGIGTQAAAAGVAVRANFGSVSNIVVRNASGSTALYLAVAGTSLTDTLVEGSAGVNSVQTGGASTIRNVIVRNTTGNGGQAFSISGAALVENCVATNNVGGCGASIGLYGAAVVRDCLFADNRASSGSGYEYTGAAGIYLGDNAAPRIISCRILRNVGGVSGGLQQYKGTAYVTNCLFAANSSTRSGNVSGCFFLVGGSFAPLKVVNCTIADNRSLTAGAYFQRSNLTGPVTFANCLFAGNTVSDIEKDFVLPDGVAAPAITHTRYAEAVAGNSDGNTAADPQLKADWTLGSASPCIGAGDWTCLGATKAEVRAQKDLAGNSRLFGGQVDMGCFEARVAATMLLLQ